jgi:DNA-binding SARP family transcriptional activator
VLQVCLFGPLALELDGVPLRLPAGATARSVLAWLLVHPGLHLRVQVASRFWPDVVDRRARASLRTAVWDIRRAVARDGRPRWLHASRDRIGVPADVPRSVDLEDFERLVTSGATEQLVEALELARRPLLSDLADDWVLQRRDDVHDRAAAAAAELARRAKQDGDVRAAVRWSRRAVRHAPLDEHAHRLLMRRLAAAGERAQALAVFERLEAALAAELGVDVAAETRSLADRLRGGRPSADHVQILEEEAVCRAPALEVWKLLQDPLRYPEWWEGLVEAERTADGLTRWMGAMPGVPIPTRVDLRRAGSSVVIRCEVTGIVHVWALQPAPQGCRVRLRAAVPANEADRWLEQQRGEVRASLPRLVRAAERAVVP